MHTSTVDYAPDLAPEDNRRATVRGWRREVATWLRENGITAAGPAWDLAQCGERDLAALRRAAAETGDPGALARHWRGSVMPDALAAADMTDWGQVIGLPLIDPETGDVLVMCAAVTVARDYEVSAASQSVVDVVLSADVPVSVSRGRGDLEVAA